jgi:hypothetical protein
VLEYCTNFLIIPFELHFQPIIIWIFQELPSLQFMKSLVLISIRLVTEVWKCRHEYVVQVFKACKA